LSSLPAFNLPENSTGTYAKQHATSNRSRQAIFRGAKEIISEVGSYESNMAEIALRAQVSRATIYNQFADKAEMISYLIDSEITRLTDFAIAADSREESLYRLSVEISQDLALRQMVESDPTDIAKLMTITDNPLWVKVHQSLVSIFGADSAGCGLILRWLIAQIASPITEDESRTQAKRLVRTLI
jgi:AcrR family transcriptional regulator